MVAKVYVTYNEVKIILGHAREYDGKRKLTENVTNRFTSSARNSPVASLIRFGPTL